MTSEMAGECRRGTVRAKSSIAQIHAVNPRRRQPTPVAAVFPAIRQRKTFLMNRSCDALLDFNLFRHLVPCCRQSVSRSCCLIVVQKMICNDGPARFSRGAASYCWLCDGRLQLSGFANALNRARIQRVGWLAGTPLPLARTACLKSGVLACRRIAWYLPTTLLVRLLVMGSFNEVSPGTRRQRPCGSASVMVVGGGNPCILR